MAQTSASARTVRSGPACARPTDAYPARTLADRRGPSRVGEPGPTWRAQPADRAPARRIGRALVEALRDGPPDPERDVAPWAAAGACRAAVNAALERGAADDGRSDLPALIERALAAAFGEAP